MNKTELIDALAERLGDKKIAAAAVAGLVDVVVRTVNGGDKVTITGFGVFEKRARAARMARNPRTGQSVKVKKTNVPAFRPGTLFREVVSGARKLPRVGGSANGAAAARPAASATSHLTTGNVPAARSIPAVPSTAPQSTEVQATDVRTTATKTETKSAKAAKVAKAAKAAKADKAATKAAKTAKKESKATPKAATTAPAKVTARKAVKKSATKK
ncbi:MAG: HU family DNA-binding protein [Pseudonocardiaceae bacterium]